MKLLALAAVLYFDVHNHFTGVLPYQAYANLPAYAAHFADPRIAPTLDYPPFSPPGAQRFALGARATLVVYRNRTISYWNASTERFRSPAPGITEQTLFDNVAWHQANMAGDEVMPY